MHYHVTDWTFSTPIAPVVDPDGETVNYLSYVMCTDGRVLVCWQTEITGNVRSRVKVGYAADVDTFVNTAGSVTTGTTLFRSTNNAGGGRGVIHGAVSIGPDGYPWLIVTGNDLTSLVVIDSSIEPPSESPVFAAYRTVDDGASWQLMCQTTAGPRTLQENYPRYDSTTSVGTGSGVDDRVGAIEYNYADPRWGNRFGVVKATWFGTDSGAAIYLIPTEIPPQIPRTSTPTPKLWGSTRLVGYYPQRNVDNGFAVSSGSVNISVPISPVNLTGFSQGRYGFIFHTEAPLTLGRTSHGLWMSGRENAIGDPADHTISPPYGAAYALGWPSPGDMAFTVNATSNVGNQAGTSATFTSGPIENAFLCQPRYGRIIRHSPGGVATLSIFCVDVDPGYNTSGQSLVFSPWTASDEVVGGSAVVPPAGWLQKAAVTGWSSFGGRQYPQAYAYPLCNYLVVASADEITYAQIRTCVPPRRLHIPHKRWWYELRDAEADDDDRKRRVAYDHAHQNWAVIARWCNDVWLARQQFTRGCPPPLDYVETGPFHPPYSHPREEYQFEQNYLALERWGRPANVCWSRGLHVHEKRVLPREEVNLLEVERWANLPPVGSKASADCLP